MKISEKSKIYKQENAKKISSLRTVNILPGDLRVAGCFFSYNINFKENI